MKKIIEVNLFVKKLMLSTRDELIQIAKNLNLDTTGFKNMIAKRIVDELSK